MGTEGRRKEPNVLLGQHHSQVFRQKLTVVPNFCPSGSGGVGSTPNRLLTIDLHPASTMKALVLRIPNPIRFIPEFTAASEIPVPGTLPCTDPKWADLGEMGENGERCGKFWMLDGKMGNLGAEKAKKMVLVGSKAMVGVHW